MNIFYIDYDPVACAEQMVDKHVVKMILETAQLLSTAHRVIDGEEYEGKSASGRKAKRWSLPDNRELVLYQATHVNHPSAVWCRQSNNNYNWLYCHFEGLLKEYTYRYGKTHKCAVARDVFAYPPHNIPCSWLTPVTPAMPEEYLVKGDPVASYRNYYRVGKKHLHKWTKRQPPEWLGLLNRGENDLHI
jgi:hypothetical protein